MRKLRNRLYVALLPLQVLLVGLAVWTFFLLSNLDGLVTNAKSTHEEFAEVLDRSILHLRGLSLLIEMTSEVNSESLRDQINESRKEYLSSVEAVQQNTHASKMDSMSDLIEVNERLEPRLNTMFADINNPLIAEQRTELLKLCQRAENLLEDLSTAAIGELLNLQDIFRVRISQSFVVLAMGIILGVIGTLLISRQIGRMILSPLERLEANLEDVSRGNLDVAADFHRTDEIGSLAHAFNQMVKRLRDYRNLTDQKLLTTTRTFRSVLQRTPYAILFLTSDLKVFFANPPAGALLEANEFKDDLPEPLRKFAQDALDSGDIVVQDHLHEAIRINVASKPMYFLVSAFPVDLVDTSDIDSGGLNAEGVALLIQDVTRMKLVDNLKGNLVATVSHELKTPLTSARMSLYLLSEQSVGPLNEEQQELVDTAKEDLERQLATIQNLLDLSRVEQSDKRMHYEVCRVNDIIERSVAAHRDLAESSGITLISQPDDNDPYISADAKRIEIVLNNFLSNALRHSPENSEIVIQSILSGDQVRCTVCDQGPGVPEDMQDQIFERFTQGEDSKHHGSAGLGLHIAKEIIEDHGGEIGCESVLGQGSNFYFVMQSMPPTLSEISTEDPT